MTDDITEFEYPDIKRTDFIDDSLPKILARDDAAKNTFRRKDTFPAVTADDLGMKVWKAGDGIYQLTSVDPEPYWKRLTNDKREPTYNDWVIENYQPISSVLTSMSRLGTVSNAIPYFNGPSDIQATTITPLTRQILAGSDPDTIRNLLGLGTAATLNTPISGNNIEAGSISKDKIDEDFARNLGWTTGDVKLTYKTVADDGWVMMHDGSIGNASSGATERANADCYDLFMLLWNYEACTLQTFAGVDTGKTTAIADWSANKRLVLPRTMGRALAGVSDGTASGISSRPIGSSVGKESYSTSYTDNVTRLSDGTIIQWGWSSADKFVTFKVPYSDTSYSVTQAISEGGHTYDPYVTGKKTTGFTHGGRPGFWIAIGK